jgi:hypothetical protein
MFTRDELTAALPAALKERDKFLAAHWLLGELHFDLVRGERVALASPGGNPGAFENRPDGSYSWWLDGLEVTLRKAGPPEQYWTAGGEDLQMWPCSACASFAQTSVRSEQWRRRLAAR